MATRLYLSRELRPVGQTVTPDSGWEKTTGALLARLEQRKQTTFTASTTSIAANGTSGNDTLLGQWISSPLDSNQTISGTVAGQMRMAESAAGLDSRVQCIIRVVQSDLSTVRGTLLAMDASALSHEFNTSLRNISIPLAGSQSLTSVNAQTGDVIVVEIGARQHATASGNVQMSTQDSAGTDLAVDETTTTANDPWIEFSGTITFSQGEAVVSQSLVESAYAPTPDVRVSQEIVESGYAPSATTVRVSQNVVEVAYKQGVSGTTTDSMTLAESLERVLTLFRTVADAVSFSESVEAIKLVAKTATDSLTISESVARLVTNLRTISDSLSLSDSVSRAVSLVRSVSDSVTLSDVATGIRITLRSVTDSSTLSESVVRIVSLFRTTSDAVTFSESISSNVTPGSSTVVASQIIWME